MLPKEHKKSRKLCRNVFSNWLSCCEQPPASLSIIAQSDFVYRFRDTDRIARKNCWKILLIVRWHFAALETAGNGNKNIFDSYRLRLRIRICRESRVAGVFTARKWKSSIDRRLGRCRISRLVFVSHIFISLLGRCRDLKSLLFIRNIIRLCFGRLPQAMAVLLPSQHNSFLTWHCFVTTKRNKLNKYWPNYGNSEITRKHCRSANKQISSTHNRLAVSFHLFMVHACRSTLEFTWQSIADINSHS